jgi:hypothetical protein
VRAIYSVPGTETEGWGGSVRRARPRRGFWVLSSTCGKVYGSSAAYRKAGRRMRFGTWADQFGGLIRSASEAEITSSSGFAVQYPDNLSASARRFRRA